MSFVGDGGDVDDDGDTVLLLLLRFIPHWGPSGIALLLLLLLLFLLLLFVVVVWGVSVEISFAGVTAGFPSTAVFNRFDIVFKRALSLFAVEYKLFLISFASIRIPQSL